MTNRSKGENIQVRIIRLIVNVKISMFSCTQDMLYSTVLPGVWSSYRQSCEDFFSFILRSVSCVTQTYSCLSVRWFNYKIWCSKPYYLAEFPETQYEYFAFGVSATLTVSCDSFCCLVYTKITINFPQAQHLFIKNVIPATCFCSY
jgi:hypothetical protein